MADFSSHKADSLATIAIFAFNRPDKISNCLKSLANCYDFSRSKIVIFQDGPIVSKSDFDYEETTRIIEKYAQIHDLTFIKNTLNRGLQESIISGINKVFETTSKIIVVEDDLVVSPYFINYCNEYLKMYEDEKIVASIHGYAYPIEISFEIPYFLKGADCWGWATWRDRWEAFEPSANVSLNGIRNEKKAYDFDMNGSVGYSNMLYRQSIGKLNSWAIRWHASMYLQNRVTLYPVESHVLNTGADGSGTNVKTSTKYETKLANKASPVVYQKPTINKEANRALIKYYRKANRYSILKIITYKILDILDLYGNIVFK